MSRKKYPELESAADEVARLACFAIIQAAARTESEMPYKAQFILEMVIELLHRALERYDAECTMQGVEG